MGKVEVYCPACGKLFNSEELMLQHYEDVHDSQDGTVKNSQQIEEPESVSGMIRATTIVENEGIVGEIKGKYTVIYDQSLLNIKFDNLVKAINVMAGNGWKCTSITSYNNSGS